MNRLLQLGMVTALAASLAACSGGRELGGAFSNSSDMAVAHLAKGDLRRAERSALDALEFNPRDALALLVMAQVYQSSNRTEEARQYYRSLIGQRPVDRAAFGVPGTITARPVTEIAEYNLALLEGREPPRLSMPMPPAPAVQPSLDRPSGPTLAETDQVISRFATLRRLLEEGLITQTEHDQRRSANLGVLLPMTKGQGADGLDAPAPGAAEIVERLRAINAALEIKAVSPREHATERATILDGLLPAAPQKLAPPPPAPTDVLDSADRLARLERMREAKIITDAEKNAERAAVVAAVEAHARAKAAANQPQQLLAKESLDTPAATPKRDPKATRAVHLASQRSAAQANKEWQDLQAKHPELKPLKLKLQKVTVRGTTFFRIKAGPLTQGQADQLCKTLKAKRQFCDVMGFAG